MRHSTEQPPSLSRPPRRLPGPPTASPIARMRRFTVRCDTSNKQADDDERVPLEMQETEGILFSSGVVVLDAALTPFITLAAMKEYLSQWGRYSIRWIDR